MRGHVQGYDVSHGKGQILGEDGVTYEFVGDQVKSGWPLADGQAVSFEVGSYGQAFEVHAQWGGQMMGARGPQRQIDLGRVINRTFKSIQQNALIYFSASAVLVGIPSAMMATGESPDGFAQASGVMILVTVLGYFLYFAGTYLLQGMVVNSAFNGFSGKDTPFNEAFKVGLRKALPLTALAIVSGLAIGLASVLLIVPGLILMVFWLVAAPVLVVEKKGIFESMKRSQALSKGSRWHLFGLSVIYFILMFLVQTAIGLLFGGIGAIVSQPAIAGGLASIIANIVTGVVSAAGVAALYYELRTVKEGALVDDLAAVFD